MKKQNNSLLSGNAVKSIITFALPIMLSSLFQYNYTLVDNIIVGRYVSTDALAAVGGVASINSFIIGAALGLTSGFTIPVAHAFGNGDKNALNKYAGSSISLALIIGIFLVFVAHIVSDPLLKLIGTPAETIELSSSYINILYFGIPFQMLSNNFTAISRCLGDSKRPLYYFSVSVIVNLILDIVFVKHLGLGVEGAAYATIISYITAASLTGYFVLKKNANLTLSKSDFIINKNIALRQIKLGIPVSLQFTITAIGSMTLQSAVNFFGANVVAGFTAANRIENITNLPLSALGVATQTFVGQNYGAKNYGRIIKNVKKILLLDISISIVMSFVLIFAGPHAVKLFMTEENSAVLSAAQSYLMAVGLCYSLVSVLFVLRNTLQGLGFTLANTVAGIGELTGRIAIALVFTPLLGFNAVCFASPAAWLMANIPLVIIYIVKHRELKRKAPEISR